MVVAEHVLRGHDAAGKKQFAWRRGGTWGLGGVKAAELPLFLAEHVPSSTGIVVVTEGEKAADAARRLGLVAVGTVTGASGCPGPKALEVLRRREVALWPDNDDEGRKHMDRVAHTLAGVAARVGRIAWPDAPPKGDAADFGGTAEDVMSLLTWESPGAASETVLKNSKFGVLGTPVAPDGYDGVTNATRIGSAVKVALHELDRFAAGDFSAYAPTGISSLDRKLGGGLRKGQVTLLGAPTGGAKTTVLQLVAITAAMKRGPVLLVSPEMGAHELAEREILRRSGAAKWRRSPWRSLAEETRASAKRGHETAAQAIARENAPLYILDRPSIDMDEVEKEAEALRRGPGLSLVCLDYAQELASFERGVGGRSWLSLRDRAEARAVRALARGAACAVERQGSEASLAGSCYPSGRGGPLMVVKRHGKGWRADWRTDRGVRKRRTFKLKSEAEAHETRMRARSRSIRDGDAPPPAGDPDITLERFVREILQPRRVAQGIAVGTLEREGATLEHHILPALGGMRVRAIHRPTIREWVLGMLVKESHRGGHLTEGSVRVALATLSGVFAEAVVEQLIATNPSQGIWREVRKGRAAKRSVGKRVKALTTDQAIAFLATAKSTEPGSYPALALMTLAGLRAGEALAVTAERIDLKAGALLVDQQLTQFAGLCPPKGGEAGPVQLAPQLVEILKGLTAARASGRVVGLDRAELGAAAAGPFLLAPELPEKPTGKQSQQLYRRTLNAMRRALKRAGLPSHFGLHALRHTYGTGLVSRGYSLAFVQQQMRHKSIKTTVDDYGSALPVEQPGALQRFATELLGGGHLVDTLEEVRAVNSSQGSELPKRRHVLDVLEAGAGVEDDHRIVRAQVAVGLELPEGGHAGPAFGAHEEVLREPRRP